MWPRAGSSRVVRQRKSCWSLEGGRLFERSDVQAHGIDAVEHVPDHTVLTAGVEGLQDHEQGKPLIGEQLFLGVSERFSLRVQLLSQGIDSPTVIGAFVGAFAT